MISAIEKKAPWRLSNKADPGRNEEYQRVGNDLRNAISSP
jgi:hypothetical protein